MHIDSVGLKAPIIRLSPLSRSSVLLSLLPRLAVPANKYRLAEIVNEVMLMLDFKGVYYKVFHLQITSRLQYSIAAHLCYHENKPFVANFQYDRVKSTSLILLCSLKASLV